MKRKTDRHTESTALAVFIGICIGIVVVIALTLVLTGLITSEKLPEKAVDIGCIAVIGIGTIVGSVVGCGIQQKGVLTTAAAIGIGILLIDLGGGILVFEGTADNMIGKVIVVMIAAVVAGLIQLKCQMTAGKRKRYR